MLEKRLHYLPIEAATEHSGLAEQFINYWWLVDREKGLVFYGIHKYRIQPQANLDKRVADIINKRYYAGLDFEVKQITEVWVPMDQLGRVKLPEQEVQR